MPAATAPFAAHPVTREPRSLVTPPVYRSRMAAGPDDLRAAQALRFEVFNLELDEGLALSWDSGLDADPFDAVCDHLIIEDAVSGAVIGTYRMQTGQRALQGLGYYSEREFDFAPFEAARGEILELGRACIHRAHRNYTVLNLLWSGIAAYAKAHQARYLLGCSSLTSQDEGVGAAAWQRLSANQAPAAWRTQPTLPFRCAMDDPAEQPPPIPKLLGAYLALGARLCGPPAIDREFRTIDFLTLLDLQSPRIRALQLRGRFAG